MYDKVTRKIRNKNKIILNFCLQTYLHYFNFASILQLTLQIDLKRHLKIYLKWCLKTYLKTCLQINLETRLKTHLKTILKTNLKTSLKTNLKTSLKTNLKTSLKTNLKTCLKIYLRINQLISRPICNLCIVMNKFPLSSANNILFFSKTKMCDFIRNLF